MIYNAIRARLLTDPDIKAAVTGIFRLQAPQGTRRPFITLQQISRSSFTTLLGDAGTHEARYQVNIIADDPEQTATIATRVRAMLSGWQQSESPKIAMDLLLEVDSIDHQPGSGSGVARIQQDFAATFEASEIPVV